MKPESAGRLDHGGHGGESRARRSLISVSSETRRALRGHALLVAIGLVAATVAIRAQASRIISIVPATTEMLFAIGAGDRVIAVGTYDRFPPEVDRLPRLGALLDPNVERIIAMRPDLVVLYGTQDTLRAQLERASIPYYAYTHRGLSDVADTMRSLGRRVGVAARANEAAQRLEQQIASVRAKVAGRAKPKALLVFGREPRSLRGIDASGGVGFLHDMLEAAGAVNALADVTRQAVQMSTEMVLARAPDVIIELRYTGGDETSQADVKAWDALPAVPAVRNKRVFLLQGEEFVVPGPRVGHAVERLSRTIHPDAWR